MASIRSYRLVTHAAFPGGRGLSSRMPWLTWTFTCLDSGRIATEVPDQLLHQVFLDEHLMHTFGQACFGELVERAREGGLQKQAPKQWKAADPAQCPVDCVSSLDWCRSGRQPQDRLGNEGSRCPTPHHAVVISSTGTHARMWMRRSSFGISAQSALVSSGISSN